MARDKEGNIVVADSLKNRIQKFSGTGEFISAFDGDLNEPNNISIGNHGNIIVADTGNHRIQVFSPDGQFLFFNLAKRENSLFLFPVSSTITST